MWASSFKLAAAGTSPNFELALKLPQAGLGPGMGADVLPAVLPVVARGQRTPSFRPPARPRIDAKRLPRPGPRPGACHLARGPQGHWQGPRALAGRAPPLAAARSDLAKAAA
jgi:hypothetical protein